MSTRITDGFRPGWQRLLDAIDAESDPVRAQNLTLVATHVVDAAGVVTEGMFRFAYPGSSFPHGTAESGEPVRADHWYMIEYQCIVVWPIRDGVLEGEDLYVGEPPRVVRALADGEHPELGPVVRRNGAVGPW